MVRVKRDRFIPQELRKFNVKGNPKFHYLWVNPRLGPPTEDYVPVKKSEVEKGEVKLEQPTLAVDNETSDVVEREGLILYKVPQEKFDEMQKEIEEEVRMRQEDIQREEIRKID